LRTIQFGYDTFPNSCLAVITISLVQIFRFEGRKRIQLILFDNTWPAAFFLATPGYIQFARVNEALGHARINKERNQTSYGYHLRLMLIKMACSL
jgi:hypothetical protein